MAETVLELQASESLSIILFYLSFRSSNILYEFLEKSSWPFMFVSSLSSQVPKTQEMLNRSLMSEWISFVEALIVNYGESCKWNLEMILGLLNQKV